MRLPSQDAVSEESHQEQKKKASVHEVELLSWEEFLEEGKSNPIPPNLPKPDDICTLCYTSGNSLDVHCTVYMLHPLAKQGVISVLLYVVITFQYCTLNREHDHNLIVVMLTIYWASFWSERKML